MLVNKPLIHLEKIFHLAVQVLALQPKRLCNNNSTKPLGRAVEDLARPLFAGGQRQRRSEARQRRLALQREPRRGEARALRFRQRLDRRDGARLLHDVDRRATDRVAQRPNRPPAESGVSTKHRQAKRANT